ncbi:hypothetical protein LMG28614_00547 [Paraburkholderia ultramafica]|uniref:Uncharacterized protein n=1 Tax=Paraburkholderia ultramafica TaxID=1544867 RepID=A0A6S7B4R8_9BURK|nr:hypothetical protein [Paraburkholderia ultramafica]CAB3778127.1 hypothetical protein LMG28614_00547 [Paraburkholderia ultramafica]
MNATNDEKPSLNLRDDIARCEICISLAARAGVRIPEYILRAVKNAYADLEAGKISPKRESAFYHAMAYIVAKAPYPNAKVADDLKRCSEVVSHAGLNGKKLAESDVDALAAARQAQKDFTWSATVEVPFYDAMSRITEAVAPVVGETVGAEARKGARKAIRNYSLSAAALTLLVLALSCLLFAIKEISDDIKVGIQSNDPISLVMHNQLQAYDAAIKKANENPTHDALAQVQNSPEADAIKETLQKFATNNRQLYSDIQRTGTISKFFFWVPNALGERLFALFGEDWGDDWGIVKKQYAKNCSKADIAGSTLPAYWECSTDSMRAALEIDLPLFNIGLSPDKKTVIPEDTVNQGFQKIALYQQIRATAKYAQDNILTFVGMTTGFVLPILYAWLGATAAILRRLRDDTAACLFHPEYSKVANRSHVTTAVIVGISIGLFSDIVQEGKTLSPLAIAFIAGYASDKFFQFLDRLVATLFPSDSSRGQQLAEHKGESQTRAEGTRRPAQS